MTVRESYPFILKLLHWLLAVAVFGLIAAGLIMADIGFEGVSPQDAAFRDQLYAIHKASGVTVLALMVLRLVLRLTLGGPPLPATTTAPERLAARGVQALLYILLFATPILGWLAVSAGGFLTLRPLFDADLPALIAKGSMPFKMLFEWHFLAAMAILALVALHIAGGLRHLLIKRDGVFKRMWF